MSLEQYLWGVLITFSCLTIGFAKADRISTGNLISITIVALFWPGCIVAAMITAGSNYK